MSFPSKLISSLLPGIVCSSLLVACGQGAGEPASDVGSVAAADTVLVNPTTLGAIPNALTFNQRVAQCQADPRVTLGLVTLNTCVGADVFFRETFNGNGRTCGTCHPSANNFTIDPTFVANLLASNPMDPLFVATNDAALANLEIPVLLEDFALIRENVDGFTAPPAAPTKFVMRSVPHMFSLNTSIANNGAEPKPPNELTGWSGDGAPFSDPDLPGAKGLLLNFLDGAIRQHYPQTLHRNVSADAGALDFRFATAAESTDVSSFLHSIGRLDDNFGGTTTPFDVTKFALADAGAEAGRKLFGNVTNPASGVPLPCTGCHTNATATTGGINSNFNFDTGAEEGRISTLAALAKQNIPTDGGFGKSACPPSVEGSTNLCFGDGTFNLPPLIEAAGTPPFFHTNGGLGAVSNTIEEAITFYTTANFTNSPAGQAVVLTPTEIADLGRFLRVLNASFNAGLTLARLNAVVTIASSPAATSGTTMSNAVQVELLALAQKQVLDAVSELSAVSNLDTASQTKLNSASTDITNAITATTLAQRVTLTQAAITLVTAANTGLTTSASANKLTFNIGEGTLMF